MLLEYEKRGIAGLLAIFMLCILLPIAVRAESAGELQIYGDGLTESDYIYDSAKHTLSILSDKPMTISGNTKLDTIIVNVSKTANITLNGVNIDVSASDNKAALLIANGESVKISLKGTNCLKGGLNCAGIQKENGYPHSLELTDADPNAPGILDVYGGEGGAGIGGGKGKTGAFIIFSGARINAYGGVGGAGIGGGAEGSGEHIYITGGEIVALGGENGAGIGGGKDGDGVEISIGIDYTKNAKVIAQGGKGGAGIGGGEGGSVRLIQTGVYCTGKNTTIIANGGVGGAGIGSGAGLDASGLACYGAEITIDNGNITATGGDEGAGIGGGRDGFGERITIAGGIIKAEGGQGGGAGIGGGGGNSTATNAHMAQTIVISNVADVTATGGSGGGAGIGGGNGGYGRAITLSGGSLISSGTGGGAGIGGGKNASGTDISIADIVIKTVGDEGGAGIGGGSGGNGKAIVFACGTVEAIGGDSVNGGGAGVGGGAGGSANDISFSGGSLNANGGKGENAGSGAKIGNGGTIGNDGDEIEVFFRELVIGEPQKAQLYTFTLLEPSKTPMTLKTLSANDYIGYIVSNVKTDGKNKVYLHLPPFEGTAWVLTAEEDRLGYINKNIDSIGRDYELSPVMLSASSASGSGTFIPSLPTYNYDVPQMNDSCCKHILSDIATQISVRGSMHKQAELNIEDPELTDAFVSELEKDKGSVLGVYDISLVNNPFTVSFPVPNEYNGKEIEILLCTGENIQTLTSIAQNGVVSVETSSLGTFLLRLGDEYVAPVSSDITLPPQTGDCANMPWLVMLLAAVVLAYSIDVLHRRNSRIKRSMR